jgi:CDP-glucose 4,6-dehydratase
MESVGVNPSFWAGRRVLLTGHTGFKGSWLALWLQRAGASVFGIARDVPTEPSLFGLASIGSHMVSREGDIRDLALMEAAIADHRPEIVFHLAAQPLVRRSYEQPLETYSSNVLGTVTVLEALRRAPFVRAALIVTSDKCYENDGRAEPFSEADPLGGADPYSSSKGAAELVTAAYRKSFFAAPEQTVVATVRAGNVIGGGDWGADRLVPDVMQALVAGKSPIIRSPDAVRPWQHVLDCLNGYLTLAERITNAGREYAGAWNFGPDPNHSRNVRYVVDYLCQAWQPHAVWHGDVNPQPPEARYLQLDSSKAHARLSWQPRFTLEGALDAVVGWYRSYAASGDMRRVTLDQIESFEQNQ